MEGKSGNDLMLRVAESKQRDVGRGKAYLWLGCAGRVEGISVEGVIG
jgi:hypothetical protein